jgi:hypothetical protein
MKHATAFKKKYILRNYVHINTSRSQKTNKQNRTEQSTAQSTDITGVSILIWIAIQTQRDFIHDKNWNLSYATNMTYMYYFHKISTY